jgi:hypothetical protein
MDVTEAFITKNLISHWPGAATKGSKFPLHLAKRGALDLLRTLPSRGTRMILVGGRVAKVFKCSHLPLYEWRLMKFTVPNEERRIMVGRIPHPSGVNVQWNDPTTALAVRYFLLPEVGWGPVRIAHEMHSARDGGFRCTLTYEGPVAVETCECGYEVSRACEHSEGIWPNNKSTCEWNEDGSALVCTGCGEDVT